MEFKPIKSKSGNIVKAGYDAEKKVAEIHFKNGGVYQYPDVSEEDWQAFESTFSSEDTSTGSYFAKHWRSRKFNKLGEK